MSDPYYVYFENAKAKIDKDFFAKVAKWLLARDCKYLSFWVKGDEVKASLDEAVERLSQGGRISFLHGRNSGLSLDYQSQLTLVSEPVNFGNNPSFTDFFINTATHLYSELKADRAYGTLAVYSYSAEMQDEIERPDFVSWLNIFNPDIVKAIGKEKLTRVSSSINDPLKNEVIKAYKAETLRDGSFLLVLTRYPFDTSMAMQRELRKVLYER